MPIKDPEKRKEWYKRRDEKNKQMLLEMKSKPCTDCKRTYPTYVMEFDHVPGLGKKKSNIAAMAGSRSLTSKSFVEELKKCELVCSNCHRIRTFSRIGKGH